ncbi:MAG: hypothetical protein U5R31_17695 [Acidimicrobiia bacterium]|nr:hypothetical protein [Acidimicrobiia bacterium]
MEAYALFDAIIQDRRSCPRHDLASVLANGTIDGEPLGLMETLGYYLIVFSAGHDTTKNALVGGMQAFAGAPTSWAELQSRPELIDKAQVEEGRPVERHQVNYMKTNRGV